MKSFFSSLWARIISFGTSAGTYARAHKIITGVVVLVLIGAGWWGCAMYAASKTTTQYTVQAATMQPIAVTVTGSGTVSAEHQLDLSPKASGTLTSVVVTPGQKVVAGQLIATVDSTTAQKSVRDALTSLESAKISYKSSISSANDSVTNSQSSLTTAGNSGFDTLVKAYGDLPTIMTGLKADLYDTPTLSTYVDLVRDVDPSIVTERDQVDASYNAALSSYNQTLGMFQAANRSSSSPAQTLALLQSAFDTVTKVSQAVKDALAFMNEVNTDLSVHNNITRPQTLAGYITTFNGYTSTVASDNSSISSAQTSITTAQQQVQQNTASINGSATLNQESAQINFQKAQNSYSDALTALADYTVRAPFAGTIASVSLQKFDTAGSGTKVATLITTQQYVNLSMNETDITSIKVGQPVSLTFDAIDGLTVDGTVAEVDQIGTVSQNVTNYTVKVGFSTTDVRVKPGMTAEATITTASKDSALVIPVAALKTTTVAGNTEYYVEVATASSTTAFGGAGARTGGARPATSTAAFGGGAYGAGRTASSTRTNAASSTATSTNGFAGGTFAARSTTVDTDQVTITRVPVTIGLQSDTQVEITSGLTLGQRIVTASLNASGKSTATQSKGLFSLFGGGNTRATGATGAARTTGTGGNATFRASGGAAAAGGARPAGFGG